jgi:GH43 family beta-xylosidase
MALGAECPVINQLRLAFGAFTCNILVSDLVSLLLYVNRTHCSAKKWYISVLADQTGENSCLQILSSVVQYGKCVKEGSIRASWCVKEGSIRASWCVKEGSIRASWCVKEGSIRACWCVKEGSIRACWCVKEGSIRASWCVKKGSIRASWCVVLT